jgi:hypothetical protein
MQSSSGFRNIRGDRMVGDVPMQRKFAKAMEFGFLLLALMLLICILNRDVLFATGLIPANDYAANDLLIQDAKSFSLYHGNYSRVGFYHPGPFFFQIMAICESIMVDWLALFKSPVSAHIFAGFLIHSVAIVVLFFSYRDYFVFRFSAAVATCLTVVIASFMIDTREFYMGQAYFVSLWPPLLYMAASTLVLAGLVGLMAGNGTWLPTLTCGFMMLVHGHASFVGLVPVMALSLASYVFAAALLGRKNGQASIAKPKNLGPQITISVAIIVVFLLPIAIGIVKEGSGNIQKYFIYAEQGRLWSPQDVAKYLSLFLVWPLAFILIEFFFSVYRGEWKSLRSQTLILATVLPAILFFASRGIDTFEFKYPLFWAAVLVSGSAAVSILSLLRRIPGRSWRQVLVGLAGVGSIYSLTAFGMQPVWVGVDGTNFVHAVNVLKEVSDRGTPIRVEAIGKDASSVVVVAMLAALDKRTGRQGFCVSPTAWEIAYSEKYKCAGARGTSDMLLKISPAEDNTDKALFNIGGHYATILTSP